MLLFIYALRFADIRPIRTKDDKYTVKDMVLEIILKEFKE